MSLLVLAVDRDLAGHLALAVQQHRRTLERIGAAEPSELAAFETAMRQAHSSSERQPASTSLTRLDGVDDHQHGQCEYLSRADAARFAGVSRSTIDRWVQSGQLASSRHGQIRRIRRQDLDAFLAS